MITTATSIPSLRSRLPFIVISNISIKNAGLRIYFVILRIESLYDDLYHRTLIIIRNAETYYEATLISLCLFNEADNLRLHYATLFVLIQQRKRDKCHIHILHHLFKDGKRIKPTTKSTPLLIHCYSSSNCTMQHNCNVIASNIAS